MMHWFPYVIGGGGVAFGLRCYLELWRWAKHCQRAKIAIAHNRRVQITAPLTEVLSWANQLGDDERTRGRVFYKNGKVSVAVLRPDGPRLTWRAIRRVRRHKREVPA